MHLVFTILDAYIHDPYERTCLAMTCKDLKQLYYSPNYVFKTCSKTIHILCFLRPQQLVELCYCAYLRNDDHVFLVRMMELCPAVDACSSYKRCSKRRYIKRRGVRNFAFPRRVPDKSESWNGYSTLGIRS